jgi:hypothetical protein
VKGSVCQIVLRDGGVRLDFVHGTSLPDPARLLQGERVAKRFVPVPTVASARRPQIASLIRSAADFVPGRPG